MDLFSSTCGFTFMTSTQRYFTLGKTKQERKRQRVEAADGDGDEGAPYHDDGYDGGAEQMQYNGSGGVPAAEPEREFFGMLTDEEQEYFRSADEKLESNDFESDEDRGYFLQSVYTEAVGKELKLASSQSCSRLMERLILLSNTRQKKRLFEAFADHFVSLVTHRFASHCCEKLFIQSAPDKRNVCTHPTVAVIDNRTGERACTHPDGCVTRALPCRQRPRLIDLAVNV